MWLCSALVLERCCCVVASLLCGRIFVLSRCILCGRVFELSRCNRHCWLGLFRFPFQVLGGSSCTNVMLYHRGEEADYDGWGVDGWTGKDVLPYFKKAEVNVESHVVGDDRGTAQLWFVCSGSL